MVYYASEGEGIGGRLRSDHRHFRVDEIPDVDLQPLDSDADVFRHLIVRVELTGWDTYGFVHRLAGALGISRERISWAGTKDKAAVTTQLFSIEGVDLGGLPEIEGAWIEPVGRFGRSLQFGDLVGNTFVITVTDPDELQHHSQVTEALRSFGDGQVAVPNYFGHQRFGSLRPITHLVGLHIVKRDWEQAVMTYLGDTSDREPSDTRKARTFVSETKEWDAALDAFPDRLQHERRLLERLEGQEVLDYKDALSAFPRSLQRLFVHAAQSYIFNRILSRRLERGLSATEASPGDVVCFTRDEPGIKRIPDIDRTQRVTPSRTAVVNRHLRNGRALITAPLVGTETDVGTGEAAAITRSVLEEVGVEPSDFELPDPYRSTGTRRAVLAYTDIDVEEARNQFSFSLPSGSYATVVMREYLKGPPEMMG